MSQDNGDAIDFSPVEISDLAAQDAVETILREAVFRKASDIYVMTEEENTVVALRRMGSVEKLAAVANDKGRQLISVMKATAGMDIAERRRPADGRLIFDCGR